MKTKMKSAWRATWWIALSVWTLPVLAEDSPTNSTLPGHRTVRPVQRANNLIGREVRSTTNQRLGKIEDLVVDLESGRVLYAIVSVGSFLGTADWRVAIPSGAFIERNGRLLLDAGAHKLMEAPPFSGRLEKQSEMESPAFVGSVYRWYGQTPWWGRDSGITEFSKVHKISELMGLDVCNLSNQKIGEVENVMIDLPDSRVTYVILSPEQSLELRNKLYALPPNALTSSVDGKNLNTSIDRDKLTSAPSFDKNKWPDMSDPTWASRVYQHFGKQAYYEDGKLLPTSRRTNSLERIYHEPDKSRK